MPASVVERAVAAITRELASGAWDDRYGDLRDRTSLNRAEDKILGERDPRHVLKLVDGIVAAKEEDLEDEDENQDKSA